MYYYIVDPLASKSQNKTTQDKLKVRLGELGISGEWAKSTGPGDATKLAQTAISKGFTTIVAVGGDDIVNESVNGINQDNVALGIIPFGDRNSLATQLGINSWQQACEVLAARRLTPYSLIAAGQKYFLSTLTLGFETDLDKSVDTNQKGLSKVASQYVQSLGHARSYQSLHAKLEVDGKFTLECDFFSMSISNQKFLNPLADNRMIVSISDRPSQQMKLGRYVWQTMRKQAGDVLDEAASTRFLASHLLVETTPNAGIMVDGKVAGRTPLAIRMTDKRVRFITEKAVDNIRDAISTRS